MLRRDKKLFSIKIAHSTEVKNDELCGGFEVGLEKIQESAQNTMKLFSSVLVLSSNLVEYSHPDFVAYRDR